MVFMCKKCKKAFRKDMTVYDDSDEYCPHCDNHYVGVLSSFLLKAPCLRVPRWHSLIWSVSLCRYFLVSTARSSKRRLPRRCWWQRARTQGSTAGALCSHPPSSSRIVTSLTDVHPVPELTLGRQNDSGRSSRGTADEGSARELARVGGYDGRVSEWIV